MDAYDPRDWAAARGRTVSFLSHVKEIIDLGLQAPTLTDGDREALELARRNLYSFDQLDKNFIATLAAAGKPSIATHGYEMLWYLMSACFYAGSRGTISGSAEIYANKKEHVARSVRGGKKGGQTRRANRPWVPHAEELARVARNRDPSASQDTIASEIENSWKLLDPKAPSHKTLKTHISEMIHAGTLAGKISGNEPASRS